MARDRKAAENKGRVAEVVAIALLTAKNAWVETARASPHRGNQPRFDDPFVLGQQRRALDASRGDEDPVNRIAMERIRQRRHLGGDRGRDSAAPHQRLR